MQRLEPFPHLQASREEIAKHGAIGLEEHGPLEHHHGGAAGLAGQGRVLPDAGAGAQGADPLAIALHREEALAHEQEALVLLSLAEEGLARLGSLDAEALGSRLQGSLRATAEQASRSLNGPETLKDLEPGVDRSDGVQPNADIRVQAQDLVEGGPREAVEIDKNGHSLFEVDPATLFLVPPCP